MWNENDHFGMLDMTIEKIKMEMDAIHGDFHYYFVQNIAEFLDGLHKIKGYLDSSQIIMAAKWEEAAKEKEKSYLEIAKEDLDRVLSVKSAEKTIDRRDLEEQKNLGMAASAARIQVMGSLELLINDRKLAGKYIALWRTLKFFLPYYISSLVKYREESMLSESFRELKFVEGSQKKETFSYAFFRAVNALLEKDRDTEPNSDGISLDYIKALLHSRIELAGLRYYQHIMEEENE